MGGIQLDSLTRSPCGVCGLAAGSQLSLSVRFRGQGTLHFPPAGDVLSEKLRVRSSVRRTLFGPREAWHSQWQRPCSRHIYTPRPRALSAESRVTFLSGSQTASSDGDTSLFEDNQRLFGSSSSRIRANERSAGSWKARSGLCIFSMR